MYKETRGKNSLVNEDSFFNEVLKNRYKDSPYSIVKEKIGKTWTLYIISEDSNTIYGGWGYYTKKDAIKDIESGKFYNNLNTEFKFHFSALDIIQKYMINKIEEENNHERQV